MILVLCLVLGGLAGSPAHAELEDGSLQLFQLYGGDANEPVGAGCLLRGMGNSPPFTIAGWLEEDVLALSIDLPPLGGLEGQSIQVRETISIELPEGELLGHVFGATRLDLESEVAAGRAHLFESVPLYASLAAQLPQTCERVADTVPPPAAGPNHKAAAPPKADDETAAEKARRLCPDGNCTEFLKKAVGRFIEILREQGLNRAPDLLQELLDGDRFVIDFDHEYGPPGKQGVYYQYFPKRIVYISPEALCSDQPDYLIAFHVAAVAMRANDSDLDGYSSVFILAGIVLKSDGTLKDLIKLLEIGGKILKAMEGPFPIISCFLQLLVDGAGYKGDHSDEAKGKVKKNLEKLDNLCKALDAMSDSDRQQMIADIQARARQLLGLIKTRQWNVLQSVYGILPGCIDPALLRFIDNFDLGGLDPDGKGDVEDLNEDEFSDVAIPEEQNDSVVVARGEGNGFFQAPEPFAVTGGPHQVATGQFDDQSPGDLAVATRSGGVVILLNPLSAPGGLASQLVLTDISAPKVLRVADLNEDGLDDLVVANATDPHFAVYLQTSSGLFADPHLTTLDQPDPILDLVLRDWTHDGIADLVVQTGSGVRFFANAGLRPDGSGWAGWVEQGELPFSATDGELQVVDADGDLRMDVLAADRTTGQVQGFLQRPPDGVLPPFRPGRLLAAPGPLGAIAVHDTNRDGWPDLLVGTREATPRLLTYPGPLWRDPAASLWRPAMVELDQGVVDLHLLDLNRDAADDLLVIHNDGLRVFLRHFVAVPIDCDLEFSIGESSPPDAGIALTIPEPNPNTSLGVLRSFSLQGPWSRLLPEQIARDDHDRLLVPYDDHERQFFRLIETRCGLEVLPLADQAVEESQPATFAAIITRNDYAEPFFQWQRAEAEAPDEFLDLPGATADNYTTPPLEAEDNGARYRCLIDNGCRIVATDPGTVLILSAAN